MGKKKSKKRNKKSKKAIAIQKQVLKKLQSNKELNQSKDLTLWQKIGRYRKLFPFGVLSFFIMLYVQYSPNSLEVEDTLLGEYKPFSNPLTFKNPNSYMVENVKIKVIAVVDSKISDKLGIGSPVILKNSFFKDDFIFFDIPSKDKKSVIPKFVDTNGKTEITKVNIKVISSFEPLFIYPNVKNDTISYTVVMNSDNEAIYLRE